VLAAAFVASPKTPDGSGLSGTQPAPMRSEEVT
jgi:hypothetical protein